MSRKLRTALRERLVNADGGKDHSCTLDLRLRRRVMVVAMLLPFCAAALIFRERVVYTIGVSIATLVAAILTDSGKPYPRCLLTVRASNRYIVTSGLTVVYVS